jgi:hypothetical protein
VLCLVSLSCLQDDKVTEAASGPFLPGVKCTSIQVTKNAVVDPHADLRDDDWTYILWGTRGSVLGSFLLNGMGYNIPIEVRNIV